jgi:hypothetical protein
MTPEKPNGICTLIETLCNIASQKLQFLALCSSVFCPLGGTLTGGSSCKCKTARAPGKDLEQQDDVVGHPGDEEKMIALGNDKQMARHRQRKQATPGRTTRQTAASGRAVARIPVLQPGGRHLQQQAAKRTHAHRHMCNVARSTMTASRQVDSQVTSAWQRMPGFCRSAGVMAGIPSTSLRRKKSSSCFQRSDFACMRWCHLHSTP